MKKNHIKDPKKVAAGKARAAQGIRIKGKYAAKSFVEVVKLDAQAAGVDPFKYFLQNEIAYEEKYYNEKISTNKNSEQLKDIIKNFTGEIWNNGRKVKKATALKAITEAMQFYRTETGAVDFYKRINVSYGKLILDIPSKRKLENALEENGEEDLNSQFDIETIVSAKKKA